MNGLGYDSWATKITDSLGSSAPPVLNLGTAVGLKPGANPHIWYSPDYVESSAKAITEQLSSALPEAKDYDGVDGKLATMFSPKPGKGG